MSFRMTPDEQRRLFDTSFEPHGAGFLFYRHRWSKGIPVSAAEREEYLAIPLLGSRRAFYRKIRDRRPVRGARDYHRSARRMAKALPDSMGPAGWLLACVGLYRFYFAEAPFDRWLGLVGGAAGVILGLWIFVYRRDGRD
ncbi:MAG: hypothetical protein ABWX67_05445 [Allosphingosinicella sp.]